MCSSDADQFSLDNEGTAAAGTSLIGTDCLAVAAANTLTSGDYIVIESSSNTCGAPSLNSKYCGQYLNADANGQKVSTPICGMNQ